MPLCVGTFVLWSFGNLVRWFLGTVVPWYMFVPFFVFGGIGPFVHRCLSSLVVWCFGALVPLHVGVLMPRCRGALVPRRLDALATLYISAWVFGCPSAFLSWFLGTWCLGVLVPATAPVGNLGGMVICYLGRGLHWLLCALVLCGTWATWHIGTQVLRVPMIMLMTVRMMISTTPAIS